MKYNNRNLLYSYSLFLLYLVVSYWILNTYSIKNPNSNSLLSITTDAFSYYDIRTVVYIYSALFLMIQNFVIIPNTQYMIRYKNKNLIIIDYFKKIIVLSLLFVTLHKSIGIILTILFFGIDTIFENHFITLSLINASVLLLYLVSISLFFSMIEIFFSINISFILTIIVIISSYYLGNVFWSPILDTRIFGKAYVDPNGLSLLELAIIYTRYVALISILILLNSIFIQRKDYMK